MHEQTAVPLPPKPPRPPVKALGTLVKEHIPLLQINLVGIPPKILEDQRPRLGIGVVIVSDVQYRRYDVSGRFVDVHLEIGSIAVYAEAVGVVPDQGDAGPRFVEGEEFFQGPGVEMGVGYQEGVLEGILSRHVVVESLDGDGGRVVLVQFQLREQSGREGVDQPVRSPRESPPVFREVGRDEGAVDGGHVGVVFGGGVGGGEEGDLGEAPGVEGAPAGGGGEVVGGEGGPLVVPGVVGGDAGGFV